MLLSIGMIVKNEEKHLRHCLNGIKPILDNLDSELIIADTGSTDGTIEIAREFTDIVYEIPWHGDFALARNTTVRRAKGQWYMFLDADEYFQDVSDIIEFFNSGEYHKYRSASHPIMILRDANVDGAFFTSTRLYKHEKGMLFKGKIHEQIPFKRPLKELKSWSKHYGNVFTGEEGKELQARKFNRNIVPLLEDYEKNPRDPRAIVHIIKEYNLNDKFDELKKFIDIGLALFTKSSTNLYYPYFVLSDAGYHIRVGEYDKAIEIAEDYFNNYPKLYSVMLDIRFIHVQALHNAGRIEESHKSAALLVDLIEDYHADKIDKLTDLLDTLSVTSKINTKYVTAKACNYYMDQGDFDSAALCVKRARAEGFDFFELAMESMSKRNNCSAFYKYLVNTVGAGSNNFDAGVAAIERQCSNGVIKRAIAESFLDLSLPVDDYVILQRLRFFTLANDRENALPLLAYFLTQPKTYDVKYADVIAAAISFNIDYSAFLSNITTDNIDTFAKGVVNALIIEDIIASLQHPSQDETLKSSYFNYTVAHLVHVTASKSSDNELKATAFKLYIDLYNAYMRRIYRDDILNEENIKILGSQAQVAFITKYILDNEPSDSVEAFTEKINAILKLDPHLRDTVTALIDKKQRDYEKTPRGMLEKEAIALKSAINTLITTGNMQKAAEVIAAYEQLNPSDPDIKTLRDRLL